MWIAIVAVGGHPSDMVAVIKLEAAKLRALVAIVVSLAGLAASSQRKCRAPDSDRMITIGYMCRRSHLNVD
jgi:hypothetical protein